MKEGHFVEGTRGITYVHKKDERRHRNRCVHYRPNGSCAYMSRCGGSAHCQMYLETTPIEYRKTVLKEKRQNEVLTTRKENLICTKESSREQNRNLFETGKIVIHKKYGKGIVTSCTGQYITIEFDDGTRNKFAVDMCAKNKLLTLVE